MQCVLFTFVIAEQLFPVFDFDNLKLLKIFFTFRCPGLESTRYRAVCCGCCCGPHIIESAVPALFSNTPSVSGLPVYWKWPAKTFHCCFHLSRYDERCALPLLCTFCTKAVREGKSSALMREVTISRGEIPS